MNLILNNIFIFYKIFINFIFTFCILYEGGATVPVAVRPKMFTKDSEITVPNVLRKLHEIISVRGKKNTDNTEQLLLLEELRKFALDKTLGIMIDVKIMFNIVSSIFDYNISVSNCMKSVSWERFINCIKL